MTNNSNKLKYASGVKKLFNLLLYLIFTPFLLKGHCVVAQVPLVESLRDVEPEDWAYTALRSLIEKYDLIAGYSDNTFQGEHPLSRYEFAALLNEALEGLESIQKAVAPNDLAVIEKLIQKFNSELAVFKGRVDGIEARVRDLEATQFSTTTKLTGQVIRAFYQFSPIENVNLIVGPVINVADYIDNNSLIGSSFRSFSTLAFANNFVLFPRPLGGGAIAEWNPGGGAFHLRAGYAAGDAGTPLPGNAGLLGGGEQNDVRLFPTGGGGAEGGLFDDPRQGAVEVEYAPGNTFAVKIHYVGGEIFGSDFQGAGVNVEWSILPQLGIFGRYGYSDYPNTTIGDLNPNYWLAGLSVSDLLVKGSLSGIAIAQPFIEDAAGDGTQTNL